PGGKRRWRSSTLIDTAYQLPCSGIHQWLLQPATPSLSTGLETPRRLRTESSLNEHLGRHESVKGALIAGGCLEFPCGSAYRIEVIGSETKGWCDKKGMLEALPHILLRRR
ncbi:MAG: hypothetical protein ABJL72_04355, partial [Roseobacter sp.]